MAERQAHTSNTGTSNQPQSIEHSYRTDGKPPIRIRNTGLIKSPNKGSEIKNNKSSNSHVKAEPSNEPQYNIPSTQNQDTKDSALRRKLGLNQARRASSGDGAQPNEEQTVPKTQESEKKEPPKQQTLVEPTADYRMPKTPESKPEPSPKKDLAPKETQQQPTTTQLQSPPKITTPQKKSTSGVVRPIDIYEDEIGRHV